MFEKGPVMSSALYLNMFDSVNTYSRRDQQRAKKKKFWDRMGKALVYGAAILGCAYSGENFMQYATVSSAVCLMMECFR